MPVRGPFGVRRPFASQQLEINFLEGEIEYTIRGPFGVKRRFAHPNPGVTDEELALCMASETAQSFIRGIGENSPSPPQSLDEAHQWMNDYCTGVLEGIKSVDDDPLVPVPEELEDALQRALEEEGEVVIDTEGEVVQEGGIPQLEGE